MKRVVVVMGVVGSGKTRMGRKIAAESEMKFLDADDFHSSVNKDKMSLGIPLTDDDRWPWLNEIADFIEKQNYCVVLACSMLKKSYRDLFRTRFEMRFIFLNIPKHVILSRLQHREHHFAGQSIVDSQFETLEIPTNEPNVITLDLSNCDTFHLNS